MATAQRATEGAEATRCVSVWFGNTMVIHQCVPAGTAAEFAAAMDRRYPDLRVKNEPTPVDYVPLGKLPAESLWRA